MRKKRSEKTRTQTVLTSSESLLQMFRQLKETVLVSEDRLSVNLKRHSVILPVQSSHAVFLTTSSSLL